MAGKKIRKGTQKRFQKGAPVRGTSSSKLTFRAPKAYAPKPQKLKFKALGRMPGVVARKPKR